MTSFDFCDRAEPAVPVSGCLVATRSVGSPHLPPQRESAMYRQLVSLRQICRRFLFTRRYYTLSGNPECNEAVVTKETAVFTNDNVMIARSH